jgi:hypothetical protein
MAEEKQTDLTTWVCIEQFQSSFPGPLYSEKTPQDLHVILEQADSAKQISPRPHQLCKFFGDSGLSPFLPRIA